MLEKVALINKVVKIKSKYILLGVLILIGLIIANFSQQSYEYRVVSPLDPSFEESMSKYSSKAWKVVSCRRASNRVTDSFGYECIMIREKGFLH